MTGSRPFPRAASVTLSAPAKVNLYLEVLARRRDGYHRLRTLFAKVGLCDTVTVRALPGPGVALRVVNRTATPVPAGPDNLAARAAALYRRRFRVRTGVSIRLVKRIPAGAGLGGGSSDAGAALRALARLFPGPGRRSALPRLAAALGADVPLFLRDGPLFLAQGAGDRLRPAALGAPLPPLVLVYPGVPVPTAQAFRRLDALRRRTGLTSPEKLGRLVRGLAAGRPPVSWSKLLFNRLEEAVLPFFPAVAAAKRALAALGVVPVMSGSGSCVFASAPVGAAGRRWTRALRRRGWTAWLVRCSTT